MQPTHGSPAFGPLGHRSCSAYLHSIVNSEERCCMSAATARILSVVEPHAMARPAATLTLVSSTPASVLQARQLRKGAARRNRLAAFGASLNKGLALFPFFRA
jgi:hypothetical protein